jgi:hypothetical protein
MMAWRKTDQAIIQVVGMAQSSMDANERIDGVIRLFAALKIV